MEDFVVTCQLVPGVPHLISDSCSSPRTFGLAFLQTPPHDDALGLLLTFGSTNKYLVRGLAPRKSYAMPGTHALNKGRRNAVPFDSNVMPYILPFVNELSSACTI